MISWALLDVSKILWGTHIRIFELTRNLGVPLISSPTWIRGLKYIRYVPLLFQEKEILLFGTRGRFFDYYFLGLMKRFNATIIYDVSDIPHLQKKYFSPSFKEIDKKLEKRFYRLVDLAEFLLVISPLQKRLLNAQVLQNKKVIIVPNAADPEFFKNTRLPRKPKTILYVGGYAPARGVDELVEAFKMLRKKNKEIQLRLIGVNMPNYRLEGVKVERNKFYRDMPNIFSESYLCVIPHKRNPYMDSALPIKLFEAMASSRPVVVTDCTEMKNLVEKEKCGIVAKDTADSLSEAIEYLISNPSVAEEMGRRGRIAVENRHSWLHRAKMIKDLLFKNGYVVEREKNG